jgi:hypothetical protein
LLSLAIEGLTANLFTLYYKFQLSAVWQFGLGAFELPRHRNYQDTELLLVLPTPQQDFSARFSKNLLSPALQGSQPIQ